MNPHDCPLRAAQVARCEYAECLRNLAQLYREAAQDYYTTLMRGFPALAYAYRNLFENRARRVELVVDWVSRGHDVPNVRL